MNPCQFPFLTPTLTPTNLSHEVLNQILEIVTNIDNRLANIENRLGALESRLQPQQPQQPQPEQLLQPLLQQQQPQQEEENSEMNSERIRELVARTFVLVNPMPSESGHVLSEPDTTSVLKKHVISDFRMKVTSEGHVYAGDLYNSMLGEAATHRKAIEAALKGLNKNPKKFIHIPQPIRTREISKFETNIKRMYKVPIDQCEKHWVGKYFIYNLFKSLNRSSSKGNERGDVFSMTIRDGASSIGATRLRLLGISSQGEPEPEPSVSGRSQGSLMDMSTGFPDEQTTCQPESSSAISFSQPSTQH